MFSLEPKGYGMRINIFIRLILPRIMAMQAMLVLGSTSVHGQSNWPILSSNNCDCPRFGIALEAGHAFIVSWSEASTETPALPGSPFFAYDNISGLGWSPLIGLRLSVRTNDQITYFLSSRYTQYTASNATLSAGANENLTPSGGGAPIAGVINVNNITSTADYLQSSLGVQVFPWHIPVYFSPAFVIRNTLSNITLSYQASVNRPSGATFLGSNNADVYQIQETNRFGIGFSGAVGYSFPLSAAFFLQVELYAQYFFGNAAADGTRTDGTSGFTQGVSTDSFYNRTFQSPLGAALRLLFQP